MRYLREWLDPNSGGFQFRFPQLLALNRIVLEGVSRTAGSFRVGKIRISNSTYQPPEPTEVPDLIEDFCLYVNENFASKSALHLAAYALWRINWIHPFVDGNGRTARIVSYIIMSAKLGCVLPGTKTIPEQIAANKGPYYKSLEAADKRFEQGEIDVTELEALLESYLAAQLLDVHDAATKEQREAVPETSQLPNWKVSSGPVVEYRYTDAVYRPDYSKIIDEAVKTAHRSESKNWFERNQALVTAIATVAAAVIGSLLTVFLSK
ncbi:MAG: Fic family protein [Beijerinckiaceae bacterium]